jgi:hypothetical protein
MSTTEEILNTTFKKVGNDFGYETSAEYAAFRDLKVRWQRTYQWAEFQVSDYLRDAPEEVLEGIARTIFTKIQGDESNYTDEVVGWLTAPEFVERLQPTYIQRDRRISFDEGEHKNLEEVVDRLKEKGFIKDLGKTRIFWSNEATSGRGGWSSALMKVITVNRKLDSDSVPDEVLDAVILNEVANIECDFAMSPVDRRRTVEDRMKLYPGFDGISEWLEDHSLEA